ncbi:hypothetical protein JV173_05070 [Acholeplasma equirhinis]|uniref:hypothetical protein n=1 Tax=Acholeplasma equirhinis TaxID=555393 RepID=UPI00197AE07A|nr:hypothetical protein [Acholeplasma equirhinis]MBN3490884.1 hypothetical protein [Acholeplasma equirhinis]
MPFNYEVKCKVCGKTHHMHVELDYQGSDEREMGPEQFYYGEAELNCACGKVLKIVIEASEYPEGADLEIYNIDFENCTRVMS